MPSNTRAWVNALRPFDWAKVPRCLVNVILGVAPMAFPNEMNVRIRRPSKAGRPARGGLFPAPAGPSRPRGEEHSALRPAILELGCGSCPALGLRLGLTPRAPGSPACHLQPPGLLGLHNQRRKATCLHTPVSLEDGAHGVTAGGPCRWRRCLNSPGIATYKFSLRRGAGMPRRPGPGVL